MGFHLLLQGIFPTQGSKPGLLPCRQTLYRLSHQGSPNLRLLKEKSALIFKRHSGKGSADNAGNSGSIPGQDDLLEEGRVTHSSVPAWRVLWTEEPGGLQSMGSQRVRQV